MTTWTMFHSFRSLNRAIYVFSNTQSALKRFKGSISFLFKSVIKIPVSSHGTFLIAGCCFSKGSSNKPSILSRIRNNKYISVDAYSQEGENENRSFQNEGTQRNTKSTIMKRNSSDDVGIEQCNASEQQYSYERDSKRVKKEAELETDIVSQSQQILDLQCSNLKESTSLENLFSEANNSITVTEPTILSKAELQLDETKEKSFPETAGIQKPKERKKEIPNYFVAVKISDSQIHKALKELQEHILDQDERLQPSMILLPTLHITLMVMHISDDNMHMRALKALQNVHEEYDEIMCKNPLYLNFKGLGHFQNRVLFAKLCMDDAYKRLCDLAEGVKRHFAASSIFSTDAKEQFTPHLTIAKLNFRKKSLRNIKKINPSLYSAYQNQHFGQQTIKSIQLLRMAGPKDDNGYYFGNELYFSSFHPGHQRETFNKSLDTEQKKKEIKEKIHLLTKQVLSD